MTRHLRALVKMQRFKLTMPQNIGFMGERSVLSFCFEPYGGSLDFFTSDMQPIASLFNICISNCVKNAVHEIRWDLSKKQFVVARVGIW